MHGSQWTDLRLQKLSNLRIRSRVCDLRRRLAVFCGNMQVGPVRCQQPSGLKISLARRQIQSGFPVFSSRVDVHEFVSKKLAKDCDISIEGSLVNWIPAVADCHINRSSGSGQEGDRFELALLRSGEHGRFPIIAGKIDVRVAVHNEVAENIRIAVQGRMESRCGAVDVLEIDQDTPFTRYLHHEIEILAFRCFYKCRAISLGYES